MPVDTAEIDHRLRQYREVERQWANNLYDLDEHPTYRLVAAGEMSGDTGRLDFGGFGNRGAAQVLTLCRAAPPGRRACSG